MRKGTKHNRMTDDMKEQTLRAIDWRCPFCHEGDTVYDSHSVTVKTATFVEFCKACGAVYERIYKLSEVKGRRC